MDKLLFNLSNEKFWWLHTGILSAMSWNSFGTDIDNTVKQKKTSNRWILITFWHPVLKEIVQMSKSQFSQNSFFLPRRWRRWRWQRCDEKGWRGKVQEAPGPTHTFISAIKNWVFKNYLKAKKQNKFLTVAQWFFMT
jgi:hypothetical protein